MKKVIPWILVIIPAAVFLMFLPQKFSGAVATQYIFSTVGAWFGSIGLTAIAEPFARHGGLLVGGAELVAAIALLVPASRHWGALLGTGLLGGALFFHLFTPLGVAVKFPDTPAGDPSLFSMAAVSFACVVATLYLNRQRFGTNSQAAPASAKH